jgi:mannose-6-phosphate isomerase
MFVEIVNSPRDYAWGSTTALAELQGRTPGGGPEAEIWFGTHPGSPARLAGSGEPLSDVAGELPYLVKLLAASEPLSLQAHPTTEQAEEGFARENALGIPLDAPERTYRDPRAKPEMVVALSGFRALAGFRPVAETRAILDEAGGGPGLAAFAARLTDDDAIAATVAWLLARDADALAAVAELSGAADGLDGPSWRAVRDLARHHPGDPGIGISLLLHAVDLGPGEGLSLPAGNIHAYLEGLAIEVLASSDNVVRGGLTSKHVDADELLRVLDTRPAPEPRANPVPISPGIASYRPGVPGVATVVAEAGEDALEYALAGAAIVVVTRGTATAEGRALGAGRAAYAEGVVLRLEPGAQVFIVDGEGR